MYLKLNLVRHFTFESIARRDKASMAPQALALSDGLGCFAAVSDAGCLQLPIVVGVIKPRDLPAFKWVNSVLGNLKTTLAGAFLSLKCRKYAEQYLDAFAYRFNRRFILCDLVARLVVDVVRAKPARKSTISAHAVAGF